MSEEVKNEEVKKYLPCGPMQEITLDRMLLEFARLEERYDTVAQYMGAHLQGKDFKDREEDSELFDKLMRHWNTPGTLGLVMAENQMMDSPSCGKKSILPFGEPWQNKTWEQLEGRHLYDLPSQRQYFVKYCLKAPVATG